MQAGIITSLSRVERPDYSRFTDPEISWTMSKDYHISFIFRSPDHNRVRELLDKYYHIIKEEFHAVLTLKE
jgi:hypothetical protein